ncbi:MAG: helix-turn-helix transcriptional regulator [Novosphingobium sp.]|nr:helix-turn-helix transcriptional regulator [Novosphingobium sp.]
MEMLRGMLGAVTAGVEAVPLKFAFRFDYLVRSGFDSRPWVDGKLRELTREALTGADRAIFLDMDPAPRAVDLGKDLASDASGRQLRSYYEHIGIRHALLSSCLVDHDWRYVLFAGRSPGQPPFGEREMAVMAAMTPHFRSALRARTRLIVAERLAESCAAGLDKLGIGVVVINAAGKLVEVSPIAERILAARDGLVASPRFGANSGSDNRRLQSLVRAAAGADWRGGGVAMAIPRPSGLPNYELVVDALPCPPGLPKDGSVVVYLRDRMIGPAQAIEAGLLQDLFGLTQAEALVACAAADGRSAHEIASYLGIRYNTVRAHFRSIFAKSGFSSRADLVHMVLNSPASLGAEGPAAGDRQGGGDHVAVA